MPTRRRRHRLRMLAPGRVGYQCPGAADGVDVALSGRLLLAPRAHRAGPADRHRMHTFRAAAEDGGVVAVVDIPQGRIVAQARGVRVVPCAVDIDRCATLVRSHCVTSLVSPSIRGGGLGCTTCGRRPRVSRTCMYFRQRRGGRARPRRLPQFGRRGDQDRPPGEADQGRGWRTTHRVSGPILRRGQPAPGDRVQLRLRGAAVVQGAGNGGQASSLIVHNPSAGDDYGRPRCWRRAGAWRRETGS